MPSREVLRLMGAETSRTRVFSECYNHLMYAVGRAG